jgi:ComF family protein
MASIIKNILSLFLQENCPLCERPAIDIVCQYCQQQIQNSKLKNPRQFWQGDLPLFAWGSYNGQLKRSIAALKYDGRVQIGELLGTWLGKAWLESSIASKVKKPIVIPIPLHQRKLKERGFNQAQLIARSFCQVTGYALQAQALARIRETDALFGLSPEERKTQLQDAFILDTSFKKRLSNSSVLLVDDIYTTGTTVAEVAKVLRQNKITLLGVAAIATPKY